jgi:hypothetical protein
MRSTESRATGGGLGEIQAGFEVLDEGEDVALGVAHRVATGESRSSNTAQLKLAFSRSISIVCSLIGPFSYLLQVRQISVGGPFRFAIIGWVACDLGEQRPHSIR